MKFIEQMFFIMENLELVLFLECFFCRVSGVFLINLNYFPTDFQGKLNWQISKCYWELSLFLGPVSVWLMDDFRQCWREILITSKVTCHLDRNMNFERSVGIHFLAMQFLTWATAPVSSLVPQDRDFSWLWFHFSQLPHLIALHVLSVFCLKSLLNSFLSRFPLS